MYSFLDGDIQSHRLAFFPAPHLESYEDAIKLYESDELFADIVARYLVKFPIRVDFSASDEKHVNVTHPKSHLSLGEYKDCRISVAGPLTPPRFMGFIFRNFYSAFLPVYKPTGNLDDRRFPETITPEERAIAHLIA